MSVKFIQVTVSDFVCPIPLDVIAPADTFRFKDIQPKQVVISHEVRKVCPRKKHHKW